MGNPHNPPDTKSKMRRKVPRGKNAVNHVVDVLYEDDAGVEAWHRGKIIMYDQSKGYLITFDQYGPEDNQWEKKIDSDDIRFIT